MPGAALRGFGRAYLNNGGAAWTRKEGQSPSGGLNERGRKSYEAANPGSDLKAPQPEGDLPSFLCHAGVVEPPEL